MECFGADLSALVLECVGKPSTLRDCVGDNGGSGVSRISGSPNNTIMRFVRLPWL
jgi:hypothetical protein